MHRFMIRTHFLLGIIPWICVSTPYSGVDTDIEIDGHLHNTWMDQVCQSECSSLFCLSPLQCPYTLIQYMNGQSVSRQRFLTSLTLSLRVRSPVRIYREKSVPNGAYFFAQILFCEPAAGDPQQIRHMWAYPKSVFLSLSLKNVTTYGANIVSCSTSCYWPQKKKKIKLAPKVHPQFYCM